MGEKKILPGNTPMMVLSLLIEREKYGWEIIKELAEKSSNQFNFQKGALYPILYGLENEGYVVSESRSVGIRQIRKYYSITVRGKEHLEKKLAEWEAYTSAINNIIKGGMKYATT